MRSFVHVRALAVCAFVVGYTGCRPIPERDEGQLHAVAEDLPLGVDRVRATLIRTSSRDVYELVPRAATASISVQSVPAGPVEVVMEGWMGPDFVGRRATRTSIVAGSSVEVRLSFAGGTEDAGLRDGGPPDAMPRADAGALDDTPWVATINWAVAGIDEDEVRGSDLRSDFRGQTPAFSEFLSDAQLHLGRPPMRFEVRTATLALQRATGVSSLADLFSSVDVTVEGETAQTGVRVASGVVGAATRVGLAIIPHREQIGAVHDDLVAASFCLRVRGPTPRDSSTVFSADFELSLTVAAF